MSRNQIIRVLLAFIITFFGPLISHANGVDPEDLTDEKEYDYFGKLKFDYQPGMHTSDLMGDKFDMNYGTVRFEYVDVSLPGNFDIEVAVRRTRELFVGRLDRRLFSGFQIGAWMIETPRITYKDVGNQYSLINAFQDSKHCSGDYSKPLDPYSNSGPQLTVPGQVADENLIVNTGVLGISQQIYRFTTKSKWRIQCITIAGGEGFRATSPQGVIYTFDLRREEDDAGFANEFGGSTRDFVFYATRVEDRFGNWVNYNYQNGELSSIASSDNRTINLIRTPSGAEVTANGRTWKYLNNGNEVTLPNGKKWEYSYTDPGWDSLSAEEKANCLINNCIYTFTKPLGTRSFYSLTPDSDNFTGVSLSLDTSYKSTIGSNYLNKYPNVTFVDNGAQYLKKVSSIKIKHPDGAVGEFWFGVSWHGVTNVQPYSIGDDSSCCTDISPDMHVAPSLLKKRITYETGKFYDWYYQYSNQAKTHNIPASIPTPSNVDRKNFKVLKIIQPDDSYALYYVNRNANSLFEGKIFAERTYSTGNALLKEVQYQYEAGTEWGVTPEGVFRTPQNISKSLQSVKNIQTKITEYMAGSDASTYVTEVLGFDAYDMPSLSRHYNNFSSNQRYFNKSYYNDTTNWLLSQPSQVEVSENGTAYTLVTNNTYHSAAGSYHSLPNCHYSYGTLVYCNTSYWEDGNNRRITYNATNRWLEYSNYKRGIAQTVSKPQSLSTSPKYAYKTVDNNGWVTRYTDFNGHCINLGYDDMGWRTLIDPCDTQWSNTIISYSSTSSNDGLSHVKPGMLKQVADQGNYQKVTYYDGMLRPRLVKEWDKTDASSARFTRTQFNHDNRLTYQSFPNENSTTQHGVSISYDSLGRVLKEDDNTILGSIDYSYLSGNRVQLDDYKGHVTTTTYLAYGSPEQKKASLIASPESVTTTINYNFLGKPTTVTQGGLTENLVYDSQQKLCKIVRPDIGNIAVSYNILSELQWQAHGASVGGGATTCDTTVSNTEKTTFSYDNLGNVKFVDYGDASPDKTFTYDRNNNLTGLVTGGITQSYGYNSRNSLNSEALSIDGKTFSLNYGYDVLGHINSMTYPSGRSVSITNNALGQVTTLGGYVTSATYHPSSAVKTVVLGNGTTYQVDINDRQLPSSLTVASPSGDFLANFSYYYDANANVSAIYDFVDYQYDIALSYDGLDRLTDADGFWGSGALTYDTMGNILSKQLGQELLSYQYDSTSKSLQSISGTKSYIFDYDERGNIIENGFRPFNYNLANQMTISGDVTFSYDGHNRRVKKTAAGKTTYSVYGLSGTLLYLQKNNGDHVDHLYLGDKLITTVESR